MSEDKSIKLFKAAKELNIGTGTIVDFLASKGFKIEKQPNAKIEGEMYNVLLKEFAVDKSIKEEAKQISIGKIRKEEQDQLPEKPVEARRSRDFENEEILIKNAGQFTAPPVEKPKPQPEKREERNEALPGVKVVGKIDLDAKKATPPPVEKKVEKIPEPVKEAIAPKNELRRDVIFIGVWIRVFRRQDIAISETSRRAVLPSSTDEQSNLMR